MQVASGNATIDSLRKDAREQTQELSQRLEQVIFSAASLYSFCTTCCTAFPFVCHTSATFGESQHGLVLNSS